jgi:hypothetical protein
MSQDRSEVTEMDKRCVFFNMIVLLYLIFHRYHLIPRFGRDTIHHFHANASAMKQLATHDFEDLLQVSPICFYDLSKGTEN